MYQDWKELINLELKKSYFKNLIDFLKDEDEKYQVYPPKTMRLNALKLTPLSNVKVVILGQDPYHEEHQAMGLAFSVQKGIPIPKSLQNIYKELKADLNIDPPKHGDLSNWAKQGVLLLNSILTVRAHQALSHKNQGWEIFTDTILSTLNQVDHPLVFILWGKYAQEKKRFINNPIHYVISSPHPSPFSAHKGFFGSKPFSKANQFLEEEAIDWRLD